MTVDLHDLQAEEAALTAAVTTVAACAYVCEHCRADDFWREDSRRVFRAIDALHAAGRPVDAVTVCSAIASGAKPEDAARIGDYVAHLSESFVVVANTAEYVSSILAATAKRRAMTASEAISEAVFNANGNTADLPGQLEVIATEAVREMRRRGPQASLGPRSYSGPEIAAMEFPDPDPVVLYAERGCTFDLAGGSKGGKTTLVLMGCKAVLTEELFLDLPTKRVPILYLTEQTRRSFRDKLESTGFLLDCDDFHTLFIADFSGLSWNEICAQLMDTVRKFAIGLLIVDTLTDWAHMVNENDAAEALNVMRPLRKISDAEDVAVITCRHTGKGDHSTQAVVDVGRGSSAFAGVFDTLCAMSRVKGQGHPDQRELRLESRKDGIPNTIVVELKDGRYKSLGNAPNVEFRVARDFLLERLPGTEDAALTEKDILDACRGQFSRRTLQRVLNGSRGVGGLVREGIVTGRKGAGSASAKAFGYWLLEGEQLAWPG
jgi:hypothetical protein